MSSSFRNQVGCGLVLVVGAGLLGGMSLLASSFDLRPTTTVTVLLEDAVGVGSKAEVMVAGVPVGRVSAVQVDHDRARLTLDLYQSAEIRSDVRVRMRAKSVLGEKYVELVPQSRTAHIVVDGDELTPGGSHTEIDEMVNAIGPLVEALDPEAVRLALASVNEALQEDPERLARMLRNADEALDNAANASRQLSATLTQSQATLTRADRAMGVLEQRARDAGGVLARADRVLGDLEAAAEPLPEMVRRADATLEEVRQAIEPMSGATEDLSAILSNFEDFDRESIRSLLREDGVRVHLFGQKKNRQEKK